MLQEVGHTKNKVVLIFRHIQCLHLINCKEAWVLASSGTQIQLQIILDLDYLPDCLSYDYDYMECCGTLLCGTLASLNKSSSNIIVGAIR